MLASTARAAFLGLPCGRRGAAAFADELADFNAAVEEAEAHNRVAIGYLRTGNVDLASLEVDRLREAWGKFGARRQAAGDFRRQRLCTSIAMTDIATRLITADLMLIPAIPTMRGRR